MTEDRCIFCRIIANEPEKLLYQDDKFVVIRDISPKAPIHLLVLSRVHIVNLNDLRPKAPMFAPLTAKEFLQNMQKAGETALKSEIAKLSNDNDIESALYGFHRPPFNSVRHLHMHVIYPPSRISFMGRMLFSIKAPWFATTEAASDIYS